MSRTFRSSRMRLASILLMAATCIMLLEQLATRSLSEVVTETSTPTATRDKRDPKVPALFNVKQYVRSFKKRYRSQLEAQFRKIYLLANAVKVYKSGLAYKFRRASHHLKLNALSDRSPLELERMRNRALDGHAARFHAQILERPPTTSGKQSAGSELKRKLLQLSARLEHQVEEALAKHQISEGSRRRKRQASLGPRELSMSDLVQEVKPVAKTGRGPESSEPNYVRPGIRPRSLIDQQEKVNYWMLSELNIAELEIDEVENKKRPSSGEPVGEGTTNALNEQPPTGLETDEDDDSIPARVLQEPDELFDDLRRTSCWFPPREQGDCGSCYAFAAISMMEYLYCVQHDRQLVAFSEQYIIDCAKGRVAGLDGCQGGDPHGLALFLHNFGLELREHYPYAERELPCPYSDETDLETTGFMRLQLDDVTVVPSSRWEGLLRFAPLLVLVATGPNFYQYGRGVDSGQDCEQEANHAMVVIGHGREDGQEYWLLRNSHGTNWGELGHYKLAKAAPERCIPYRHAYLFGTRDGLEYAVPQVNRMNPLAGRYLRQLEETRAK